MSGTKWKIAEPCEGLLLWAEPTGVWVRSTSGVLTDAHQLRAFPPKDRLGRLLPTVALQLIEMGLASAEEGGIRISHEEFSRLEQVHKIDAFEGILPWAPLTVELGTTGWPGHESFRYFIRFYAGRHIVEPERIGCFVRSGDNFFRLDPQTHSLVDVIEQFNQLPADKKSGKEAFVRFSQVKDLAEGVGAQLDEFLLRERVVVPSSISVDLVQEAGDRISFVPKIDGVPDDALRSAFMASDDVEEVYSMDDEAGGRVRVVLDETQREVLRRMQRVRHLGGSKRADVLRDPQSVFDGVAGAVTIGFGPRVRGIGDFPFVARPFLQNSTSGVFDDPEAEEQGGRRKFVAGVDCQYAGGVREKVFFGSLEELLGFHNATKSAAESGRGIVSFRGKSILLDDEFTRGMDELIGRLTPKRSRDTKREQAVRKYLLIYRNEDQLEYQEPGESTLQDFTFELPKSILQQRLQEHQLRGMEWLQRNFLLQHHGCLLADDMGLGKTLQVLGFLAWAIEHGEIGCGHGQFDVPPWNPILVITPVTLLENETWVEDMHKFFVGQGAVFQPWLLLHGSNLRSFRREEVKGRETEIGEPALDLERLRQFRIILTNYETVVNYQHSFAKMKERWSFVVTDEAQEYKTPSTKISHALKSLSPRFRIACTGTPVETRLLDVWNIFDFLQPGQLLGSAKEFIERYEKPTQQSPGDGLGQTLAALRSQLRYGSRNAFVLRRDKTSLKGLPKKNEHVLECELSLDQRDWHLDIVQRAREGGPSNHPFGLLQQLMMVYQHPSLVPSYQPPSPQDALKQCPKLAAAVECLRKIRSRGEKVLLFTRSLNMQDILRRVIESEFGIEVDILNGQVTRRGETKGLKQTRRGMVERFRASKGFNAIVLSPDVAGVGLTLVEANHVIHYGRWWNPAKESQATDRVYRIGQAKDVHVYYPIAKDPRGVFETFDQKLDAVIRRRRHLASEFLAPMPSEEELGRELFQTLVGAPGESGPVKALTSDEVRLLPWDRFEALIALLEEKRGSRVILTPRSGDDKVDVLGARAQRLRLIQCKHSLWSAQVDADVVAEILGGIDLYRVRYLRNVPGSTSVTPVIVSNGTFTSMAKAEARERDVELIGDLELWKLLSDTPCTRAEVETSESRRLESMRDVQVGLANLFKN
jgi:SNF2-related domain/Helicase conserved C-terminal domain/Restriction endonuclease